MVDKWGKLQSSGLSSRASPLIRSIWRRTCKPQWDKNSDPQSPAAIKVRPLVLTETKEETSSCLEYEGCETPGLETIKGEPRQLPQVSRRQIVETPVFGKKLNNRHSALRRREREKTSVLGKTKVGIHSLLKDEGKTRTSRNQTGAHSALRRI